MKYIILSAKPYKFNNKNNEEVKGVTISYLNSKPSNRDDEYGYPPFIVNSSSLDLDFSKLQFPGVYDMDFEQVVGKDHKPSLTLVNINFIKSIDFKSLMGV